jgi:hypothetical protein
MSMEGDLEEGLVFYTFRNMEVFTIGDSLVQWIMKRESNLFRLIG